MFKNIRRNSKQLFDPRRRKSSVATIPELKPKATETSTTTSSSTLTFFHLPAEIRNDIYGYVARETRIFVPAPSKKSNKDPFPIPNLLLVSGQTRQEYLPILLEASPITFYVRDFNFRNLMRIVSSLYSTELKALRQNRHLSIRLQVDKATKDSMASLRRWLVNRTDGLDRLHWHYGLAWTKNNQIIPTSTQVHRINTYIQRRTLLNQNLDAMAQLHKNVEEALQFELQPIIGVFEDELGHVGVESDLPWRDDSALMMYGVRMRGAIQNR